MITVVMLNWARPRYALMNIHRYASYAGVKQVFCFNNGAPFASNTPLPRKCVLMEASTNLGVHSRLAAASLAETEAIFHTDDDLAVPESTLNTLYQHWSQAKLSCHGLHGRLAYPTYRFGDVFGPAEVVLTRAVMCSRRVNNTALSVTDLFEDMNATPRGNGEDIILSFAALALSGSPNFAYQLPAQNYPDCDDVAIHRNWPNHLSHRSAVVVRCRKIFFGQG